MADDIDDLLSRQEAIERLREAKDFMVTTSKDGSVWESTYTCDDVSSLIGSVLRHIIRSEVRRLREDEEDRDVD